MPPMLRLLPVALAAALTACVSDSATREGFDVPILDAQKVYPGTTLFPVTGDTNNQRIVETDMKGKVVWRYRVPRSIGGDRSMLLDANLLKNGNILFTVHGAGIFEITRRGDVVWSHKDPEASHDADRLANGNTLHNRGWVAKGQPVAVEVTPAGKTVWSWNGLAAFDRPPFAVLIRHQH